MVAEQDRRWSEVNRVFFLSGCDTDIIKESLESILQKLYSAQNITGIADKGC